VPRARDGATGSSGGGLSRGGGIEDFGGATDASSSWSRARTLPFYIKAGPCYDLPEPWTRPFLIFS
jgi:hypothetical protein